jgi:hypothetical protein
MGNDLLQNLDPLGEYVPAEPCNSCNVTFGSCEEASASRRRGQLKLACWVVRVKARGDRPASISARSAPPTHGR